MKFIPFQAPASDHHPLNAGLSTELGVTAKGLVDGINAYFKHLFEVVEGETAHVVEVTDDAAHAKIDALAEHVTTLQQQLEKAQADLAAAQQAPAAAPQDPAIGAPAAPQPANAAPAPAANPALDAALKQATG